jgi:hypothetical protein
MDAGKFNKGGLLGHEEDVFLEHKEIALYGFEISLDASMTIATMIMIPRESSLSRKGQRIPYLWKLPMPMIFFFESARNTLETTSKVGLS